MSNLLWLANIKSLINMVFLYYKAPLLEVVVFHLVYRVSLAPIRGAVKWDTLQTRWLFSSWKPFCLPAFHHGYKNLPDNLREEVSSSVCMTTFPDPKQLPCLHSFCLHCLNRIPRMSGRHNITAWPECRRESRVSSSGNLKDLPTNFGINSLLDVLAVKECNSAGVKSGNCDKRSAESLYCFQCCALLYNWAQHDSS